jgi:hypothetical protein
MSRQIGLLVMIAAAAVVGAAAAQLPHPSRPSIDEIRADMAAGDYRGASQKVERLLFPTSSKQDAHDRYELLMLKGECRLQLKDGMGARSAFGAAEKVAGDASELAAARANALIIARSTSGRYTPRFDTGAGTGREPIDVLPLESRKRAMEALRADMWPQHKSAVDAALRGKKLSPIEKVFVPVADMFALEMFATGEATETGPTMRELGGHAYELMESEVSRCTNRADALFQMANSAVETGDWSVDRRGLHSRERDELESMLPELVRIRDRASEYRRVAARVGGDEGKWDALVADATETIVNVNNVLQVR